jgi:hypothetical protein
LRWNGYSQYNLEIWFWTAQKPGGGWTHSEFLIG